MLWCFLGILCPLTIIIIIIHAYDFHKAINKIPHYVSYVVDANILHSAPGVNDVLETLQENFAKMGVAGVDGCRGCSWMLR